MPIKISDLTLPKEKLEKNIKPLVSHGGKRMEKFWDGATSVSYPSCVLKR